MALSFHDLLFAPRKFYFEAFLDGRRDRVAVAGYCLAEDHSSQVYRIGVLELDLDGTEALFFDLETYELRRGRRNNLKPLLVTALTAVMILAGTAYAVEVNPAELKTPPMEHLLILGLAVVGLTSLTFIVPARMARSPDDTISLAAPVEVPPELFSSLRAVWDNPDPTPPAPPPTIAQEIKKGTIEGGLTTLADEVIGFGGVILTEHALEQSSEGSRRKLRAADQRRWNAIDVVLDHHRRLTGRAPVSVEAREWRGDSLFTDSRFLTEAVQNAASPAADPPCQ